MTAHTYKVGDKGMTRGGEAYEVISIAQNGSICAFIMQPSSRLSHPDGTVHANRPHPCDLMPPAPPTDAPGHTDLMVSPESLDGWLKDNPLPEPTDACDASAGTSEPVKADVLVARLLGWRNQLAGDEGDLLDEAIDALQQQPEPATPPNPELEQARVALAELVEGSSLFRSEYSMNHFIREHGPTILRALESAG